MTLEDFLSPLHESFGQAETENSYGHVIQSYIDTFPDWEEADIAIFGVEEGRNTKNKETASAPDKLRRELYALVANLPKTSIVDLGNIAPGNTFNDTRFAVQEVSRALLKDNIIPIILGGTKELAYGQYTAFQPILRNLECTVISPRIGIDQQDFLHDILLHEPNFLFNVNALAYQSHYVREKAISTLTKLYFNPLRLGVLRSDVAMAEPILRNTDMCVFDIGSVKQADAPGNYYNNPSGLTSEEACQLAWYAGMSEKMRSFGIYEVNPEFDYRDTTSKLGAQILWYFIDGYYNRKGDHPSLHSEFVKYRCTMTDNEPDVVFYKSKRTERWWMEIPGHSGSDMLVIPCTYADYTLATTGEMPDLFFKALQKNAK